jgi:prepilin peptidase CpaA
MPTLSFLSTLPANTIPLVLLSLAMLTLLYIAVSDARALRIPNAATIFLLGLGIAYGFATTPLENETTVHAFDWLSHSACGILLFIICFVLFHYGLLGGGDTKLIPVVGFWVGFADLLPFLLMMTGVGAVLGIGVAVASAIRTRKLSGKAEAKTAWRKKAMPYGIAIGVAGIFFMVKMARVLME